MILPITQFAVVLDRGTVVHRGDSEARMTNPQTLDRWLSLAQSPEHAPEPQK
jgi:branched-chain amino acid transport system ATP-binding protein